MSVTVVEWTKEPLVPVIVMVYVPVGVVVAGFTPNVEFPDPVTVAGVNRNCVPAGNPLTLKVTVPVNPFTAATETV